MLCWPSHTFEYRNRKSSRRTAETWPGENGVHTWHSRVSRWLVAKVGTPARSAICEIRLVFDLGWCTMFISFPHLPKVNLVVKDLHVCPVELCNVCACGVYRRHVAGNGRKQWFIVQQLQIPVISCRFSIQVLVWKLFRKYESFHTFSPKQWNQAGRNAPNAAFWYKNVLYWDKKCNQIGGNCLTYFFHRRCCLGICQCTMLQFRNLQIRIRATRRSIRHCFIFEDVPCWNWINCVWLAL